MDLVGPPTNILLLGNIGLVLQRSRNALVQFRERAIALQTKVDSCRGATLLALDKENAGGLNYEDFMILSVIVSFCWLLFAYWWFDWSPHWSWFPYWLLSIKLRNNDLVEKISYVVPIDSTIC